jgi:hypothetical protein
MGNNKSMERIKPMSMAEKILWKQRIIGKNLSQYGRQGKKIL